LLNFGVSLRILILGILHCMPAVKIFGFLELEQK
jgi:hypothetical protein